MTTLSAPHSSFFKYVFPFLAVFGACAWVYWSDLQEGKAQSLWLYGFVVVALTTIMWFVCRQGLWKIVDTVAYSKDTLHLKRWRSIAAIPLSEIKNVSWESGRATIDFHRPTTMGSSISFVLPRRWKPPSNDEVLKKFAEQVRSNARSQ